MLVHPRIWLILFSTLKIDLCQCGVCTHALDLEHPVGQGSNTNMVPSFASRGLGIGEQLYFILCEISDIFLLQNQWFTTNQKKIFKIRTKNHSMMSPLFWSFFQFSKFSPMALLLLLLLLLLPVWLQYPQTVVWIVCVVNIEWNLKGKIVRLL